MAGLFLMTISLLPVGLTTTLPSLFFLIAVFYLGSIIAEPARETLSASLASPRARGSYMGFSRLGLAIGGLIGYSGGGWMFDVGQQLSLPELPWMLLSAVGSMTLLALWWQFQPRSVAPALYSS